MCEAQYCNNSKVGSISGLGTVYLVVRVNKPLPCLYQHEPQPGQLTNYVLDILLFVEENLLEPPYRVGVYLSQLPSSLLR
jgi:hypothetical protein